MNRREKIKAYLYNQLPKEEMENFRQEIQQDSQLAEETRLMKLFFMNEKLAEQERVRKYLEEGRTKWPDLSPVFWTSMLVAASILGLVVVGYRFMGQPQVDSDTEAEEIVIKDREKKSRIDTINTIPTNPSVVNKDLNQSFQQQKNLVASIIDTLNIQLELIPGSETGNVGSDLVEAEFKQALALNQNKQYKKSLAILDSLDNNDADFRYLRGINLLKINKYAAAADQFKLLLEEKANRGSWRVYLKNYSLADIEYFLILAYLGNKNKQFYTDAEKMANDPGHPYSTQARILLKKSFPFNTK